MTMQKRTTFTSITPLPPSINRKQAVAFLHDHEQMIDLNPLVIKHTVIPPPDHAPPEEMHCEWHSITDRIEYVPGVTALSGLTTYTCCFHDMAWGLQTHCYAGFGLEIRDKWSVGGNEPGEEPERHEIGMGIPAKGLYLREEVDFTCNVLMAAFVRKTMKKAHGHLVEALANKAERDAREGGLVGPHNGGGAFVSTGAGQQQQHQGPVAELHGPTIGLVEAPGSQPEPRSAMYRQ
ncbi:uncharacterized protein F5Z01DRAFT_669898 [Emericellopsis atlantica]|uniref:DUF7053 domain-containing protein n=1 Tax=Emericellopsis atlantica TaxID=2614577 RepID=A0A9P8CY21_9HYPO|nr:uncharacterized protein F5Z01DRAFT_669898 [Emericellopsis atlantica]KAG9259171.1 hypothetical protein F5Z01DRAFT_669898 [Emericellopsis atlantica]